jgi:hypothetical protein
MVEQFLGARAEVATREYRDAGTVPADLRETLANE